MKIYSAKVSYEKTAMVSVSSMGEATDLFFKKIFIGKKVEQPFTVKFNLLTDSKSPIRDFMPGTLAAFIITERAAKIMKASKLSGFELLPINLTNESGVYYILNVTVLADCIDKERTDILTSSEDKNRVLYMSKPVFRTDRLPNSDFFKVPEDTERIFAYTTMVDLVVKHRLSGIYFEDPTDEAFGLCNPLFDTPFN